MFELTPQTLSNSLIASWIFLLITFALQMYVLYLNWKQSKVRDQMNELLSVMREIRDLLKAKRKR
ncbi:hypothetical protein HYY74_06230 [Candidatus Woesearchaeota archaeon]|nr:hypothetical protein [Candidatus Woesearchaeota archaeon]